MDGIALSFNDILLEVHLFSLASTKRVDAYE